MRLRNTVWPCSFILLAVLGFILVRHARDTRSNTRIGLPNQTIQATISRTNVEAEHSNPQGFTIISTEMTPTGQIVYATKSGIEKRAFIPRGMSVPENVLEATLFGQPTIPNQPHRPSDVLNSNLVFYGLVVDENSNIVTGAKIDTSVLVMAPGKDAHPLISSLASGANGRFSIEIPWGQQIMVKVTKTNYVGTPWQTFRYGNIGGLEPKYYPDENNPTIFALHTKPNSETNTAPLFSFNNVFGLPHDGSPVRIDLTKGQIVKDGGDLIVSITCQEPYTNLKQFPWEISVSVVGGGLIEEHPIDGQIGNMQEAPSNGYSEGFDLKYDANSLDYHRQLDGLYYIASRNGQIYAKVRINMTTHWDDRGVPFGIEAYVNTSGSRNLQNASQ